MRLKPAFPPGEPVTSQGRWGPLVMNEVLTILPLGEGGPLAVDELIQAFPPGEGGPLAVDEGYVGNVYPHPGYADPRSLPLRSTDLRPGEG